MSLSIGIDTGGTYTDAVIYDHETKSVLAEGKSPTTRQDLSVGIGLALDTLPKALLEKAEVFDIYRGAPILPGLKSVAFSLVFRSQDRTLTDEDISPAILRILDAVKRDFGAVLRL